MRSLKLLLFCDRGQFPGVAEEVSLSCEALLGLRPLGQLRYSRANVLRLIDRGIIIIRTLHLIYLSTRAALSKLIWVCHWRWSYNLVEVVFEIYLFVAILRSSLRESMVLDLDDVWLIILIVARLSFFTLSITFSISQRWQIHIQILMSLIAPLEKFWSFWAP